MFFLAFPLVKWSIKIVWLLLLLEVWTCWALLALPVALIASVTGHDRAARQWIRSLNWRRVLRRGSMP